MLLLLYVVMATRKIIHKQGQRVNTTTVINYGDGLETSDIGQNREKRMTFQRGLPS